MTDAAVRLWGRAIGAVSWLDDRGRAVFQYTSEFAGSGIELSPIAMPLVVDPYDFPGLPKEAFKGLPGLLADSLPDKFGNAMIDAWLARQGRPAGSFDPVERLCYIGTCGMGALEFHPTILAAARRSRRLEIAALVSGFKPQNRPNSTRSAACPAPRIPIPELKRRSMNWPTRPMTANSPSPGLAGH